MKHGRIVHRLQRRIRVLSPLLEKNEERCYILEILLRKHAAISAVDIVPAIGSLTVRFDPVRLPEARLSGVIDGILGNLARAPASPVPRAEIRVDAPLAECSLAIEGMTCASCALLIELKLRRDPRVHEVSVNFAAASVTVRGCIDRTAVSDVIQRLGYEVRPMDTLAQRRMVVEREKARIADAQRRFVISAALSVPVVLTGMLMHRSPWLRWIEFGLSTATLFGSADSIFRKAWHLARQGEANMDSLIALGAGAAWIYSLPGLFRPRHHVYFESAAGICSFVLLGRYMEERAKGQAGEAIRKLIELQPETAWRIEADGSEREVPIDDVQPGDCLRVHAGARIPTDGCVHAGETEVDEALMTGESMPVRKLPGDRLVGGCINGTGSITMMVTAVGGETVLSGIVRLVDHAQGSKLPVQKLADRISARFVPAVGGVAGLTFAGWLMAGAPVSSALAHSVAVLLIACPCALGLATPTAIMVGTGQAARRGIYLRNGEALETSAGLDTLVFDKTGTITEGRPVVTDVHRLDDCPPEAELASLVVAAEAGSAHFLARAMVDWGRSRQTVQGEATGFVAHPGRGIAACVAEVPVLIGNADWLIESGVDAGPLLGVAEDFASQGKTPAMVAVSGQAVAVFAIADRARPEAVAAIALLHRLGLKTVMATGDLPAVAAQVARDVGIERVVARCTPADKLALIRNLQATGRKVGMVGDGINDAPALTAADVGFAIGGGADIAVEAADVTLVGGDIARVAAGIDLSRRTMQIVRQNLFWALGYNVVAIPFAAAGRLTPMIAAAAMGMSSVSVVGNSLRLQR